ncbi:MAG: DUF2029 domain-containing protein [Clostridia bacterium]|nr:DUF2029 domain-containing protein [Clostridia bacterium]
MRNALRKILGLRKDPRNLFYLISAAGLLLYFLLSFRYGGRLYSWMIQENAPEIRFIDYFPHLSDAADRTNLYQHISGDAQASYLPLFPPLAYCMYHFLYRLSALPGSPSPDLPVESLPGALSVLTFYLMATALIFFLAVEITGKRNRRRDLLIFTLLTFSAVFAGSGYLTANSALLVLGLLTAGLHLKDSPNPLRRETGLLLLAVCVALKIYPAVFGLVFLKEKKYRELARFVLYSLLLFFVPFLFFGGLPGFLAWFANLQRPLQSSDFGRPQYLKGLFSTLIQAVSGRDVPVLSTVLTLAVSLLWVWLAWRSESRIRTLFFLICVMVFFPSNSFRYTLAYFSVPLVLLLKEEPEAEWQGRAAGIVFPLYGLLYTVPVWWLAAFPLDRRFEIHTLTSVEIYLYLVAYLLVAAFMFLEFRAGRSGVLPRKTEACRPRGVQPRKG